MIILKEEDYSIYRTYEDLKPKPTWEELGRDRPGYWRRKRKRTQVPLIKSSEFMAEAYKTLMQQ